MGAPIRVRNGPTPAAPKPPSTTPFDDAVDFQQLQGEYLRLFEVIIEKRKELQELERRGAIMKRQIEQIKPPELEPPRRAKAVGYKKAIKIGRPIPRPQDDPDVTIKPRLEHNVVVQSQVGNVLTKQEKARTRSFSMKGSSRRQSPIIVSDGERPFH